jgi:uncharacterized phage protein (TIGR01671 family)
MREIKFRVWQKSLKRFMSQYYDGGERIVMSLEGKPLEWDEMKNLREMSDDFVVQQYTGLKDKNGVEIYEGDILGYPENRNEQQLMEIRWAEAYSGEQWCEFEIRNYKGQYVPGGKLSDFYGGVHPDYMIVVGNIFEGVDK